MFKYLVEDNNLVEEFEKYNLTEEDREFIKEQIRGPSVHLKEKVCGYQTKLTKTNSRGVVMSF